jgi:hypothetical protein
MELASSLISVANRNFHRAGARRQRVDHGMRGSCVGAHALNHEFVNNAQASWAPRVGTLMGLAEQSCQTCLSLFVFRSRFSVLSIF